VLELVAGVFGIVIEFLFDFALESAVEGLASLPDRADRPVNRLPKRCQDKRKSTLTLR
jgi:hypothetical protein